MEKKTHFFLPSKDYLWLAYCCAEWFCFANLIKEILCIHTVEQYAAV